MAHTLPGAGSVGWTMTTANLGATFLRYTEEEGATVRRGAAPMGKWTFTPASSDRSQGTNATLHQDDLHVDLNYSSSIFEDFLEAINAIHHEFNRRSREVAASGMCTDGRVRKEACV
ncbi:hypothetical protein ACGFX2_31530 [Streptomyces goshikiensis]|uniref:hypothetical protein n=1 Tax=Streptomyces goshikiensis TaxID=1942 RepID=UPI0037117D9A